MTAFATERSIHLNGFDPIEARKLGVDKKVGERIKRARTVLEAVDMAYPDQVEAVAQIYDFEMQLTRYCAARKLPLSRGIMGPMTWHLISQRMHSSRQFRLDGNYGEATREAEMRSMMEQPENAVARIQRVMQRSADQRLPHAMQYLDRKTPAEIYNKYGVSVTDGPTRVATAGLFVPLQDGRPDFEMVAPEVHQPVYGLLSHMVRNPNYSHLFVEGSDFAEQGRGRRFFETPTFSASRDGHVVASAYPYDCDIVHGFQFDDPRLLAAITFGGLAEMQTVVRGVPEINRDIYADIVALPDATRTQMLQPS